MDQGRSKPRLEPARIGQAMLKGWLVGVMLTGLIATPFWLEMPWGDLGLERTRFDVFWVWGGALALSSVASAIAWTFGLTVGAVIWRILWQGGRDGRLAFLVTGALLPALAGAAIWASGMLLGSELPIVASLPVIGVLVAWLIWRDAYGLAAPKVNAP